MNDSKGLGKDTTVDDKGVLGTFKLSVSHHHRFCGGGSFVEERCVGDVETGKGGGERLEVDEPFKTTLGNLSLRKKRCQVCATRF